MMAQMIHAGKNAPNNAKDGAPRVAQPLSVLRANEKSRACRCFMAVGRSVTSAAGGGLCIALRATSMTRVADACRPAWSARVEASKSRLYARDEQNGRNQRCREKVGFKGFARHCAFAGADVVRPAKTTKAVPRERDGLLSQRNAQLSDLRASAMAALTRDGAVPPI